MNNVVLHAFGKLGSDPRVEKRVDNTPYTRFCLFSDDVTMDPDAAAKEHVTAISFVAFNPVGAALARHAKKDDLLFVQARVMSDHRIESVGKQMRYFFICEDFKVITPGKAKRARLSAARGRHSAHSDPGGRAIAEGASLPHAVTGSTTMGTT